MYDTKCAVCKEPVNSYSIDVNSDEMYYWHAYHDNDNKNETTNKCDVCEAIDGTPHCNCGQCDCGASSLIVAQPAEESDETFVDQTEFYRVHEPTFMCCDQSQFTYYCIAHDEKMDCQFCGFNPYEECGCLTSAIAKGNA